MKKINSKIESLVNKILNESLQEKANEMVNKIKTEMGEEEELDIENMSDDEIYDAYCQRFGCDDIESEKEFDSDGEVTMNDFDSEEIDIEDEEEDDSSFDWKYRHGKSNFGESETDEEMEEGNAFTDALDQAREDGDKEFTVGGKTYPVKGEKKEKQVTESKKNLKEKLYGKQKNLDKNKNGKIDGEDFKLMNKSKKKKEVDEYTDRDNNMSMDGPIKPKKKKNVKIKETIKMSESEMIDLIEKLVIEEKEKSNIKKLTAKGEEVYSKARKESGKENEDYIKSVTKKLKEYLKDGSKGEYDTNPKFFPKGNGELAKMEKKAYVPSDDAMEYIENFARMNGMDDLHYDEIHPIDDWMSKNIEGSSMTGNNPEWANTGETDVNKRLNQRRKKGLVNQLKMQAYNKSEQPVVSDSAGESSKGAKMKVNKIFKAMESDQDRKDRLLKEEMEKIERIVKYNKKTQ